MKCVNDLLRTAIRVFAVLGFSVILIGTAMAQPVLKLEGNALGVKHEDESLVRLSVLNWSGEEQLQSVVEAYREYQNSMELEAFQEAINAVDTAGFLFTESPAGYSIKYAWHDQSSTNDRMVFLLTPALKTLNPYMWKEPNNRNLPYTVVELSWQGSRAVVKTSLDSEIVIDDQGRLGLADFNSAETFANLQEDLPYYLD